MTARKEVDTYVRGLLLCWVLAGLVAEAVSAEFSTGDGLALRAELPHRIGPVSLDGRVLSRGEGGIMLIDPRTGGPPREGKFDLQADITRERDRLVLSGAVTAAGEEETVCMLQARLPVGDEGWLFWDNMSRVRPIRPGEEYVQSVYPVACVTDPAGKLGVAVALAPDPTQPALCSYDPVTKVVVVNWFFGFTPLARPEYRMRAPFRLEIYRVEPGWGFRSALDRYYRSHPQKFDWRAKLAGLWLFASPTESLPNPQHYAYNEGGPPPTADLARGLGTFPYSCAGDLIIPLPVEWGVPKNYQEMVERLKRWEEMPRLDDWEDLGGAQADTQVARTGSRSLRFTAGAPGQNLAARQIIPLGQKQPEAVTVSVWTKAQSVTGTVSPDFGLWLDILLADGTYDFGKVAPADVGTHDWQELKLTVGGQAPIQAINLYLLFRGDYTGTAWFDDVSVTTPAEHGRNLARNPSFESAGPPPKAIFLRDNAVYDEQDRPRWFADTWGGADVPPPQPINWIRFTVLVNPDQVNPEGRKTESDAVFEFYDRVFSEWPECAGAYLDGTSGACTTTFDYRRDHFYCFSDPFEYRGEVYRPCASGKASVIRWVEAFKKRYPGKLAFGNVWASTAMFPVCMSLDVCGYESSRWWDLDHMDYYRAAAYHKPGLLLNYFRIGQNLDAREGGEKFFCYATAYGLFPSIGRFTDEAYEKFGDLQHRYVPIVKHLFRAGWEPVTWAEADAPAVRVHRFGTSLPMYFTVLNPQPAPKMVKFSVDAGRLGIKQSVRVVEMVTSSSLPLEKKGGRLTTQVAVGPEDVAVIVLLPADAVGEWYRERAAESLQGAAYVYAQTPPTAEAAELGKRLRGLGPNMSTADVARAVAEIKDAVARLAQQASELSADLKRVSCLRELAEARRLLDESLLADVGARVGWAESLVAPVDGEIRLAPVILLGKEKVRITRLRAWPGWLVEPPSDEGSLDVRASGGRCRCPAGRTVTAVADVEFRDAAGAKVVLSRIAHAFFSPVCELTAQADPEPKVLRVWVRNADRKPRTFRIDLHAPRGVVLKPAAATVRLDVTASQELSAKVAFSPELPSGSYLVSVTVRTDRGTVVERCEVPLLHILPLPDGNLALASSGCEVAVDSCYYGYDARPVNDGVVNPMGMAFNKAAWAAAEGDQEHWVEIQWPSPQSVSRVLVYWNIENDAVWTSQRILVQARDGESGEWKTLAEATPPAGEPVTEVRFAPFTTRTLRILQPKDCGPRKRPRLMWLREVAVYSD
ncbi:MAG: hypothetical protein N2512_00430 [Armatimonadetes bacterium]|nr:hypothetical protein [Armatimonadota bacterium]